MGSYQHDILKEKALVWLRNRATRKGVRSATEVALGEGYVADAAALCSLQLRFLKAFFQDYKHPSGIGYKPIDNYFACVFEIKISRSDFLATFGPNADQRKNRQQPISSLHWCVCPKGLIIPEELPTFWGLLVTSGTGLKEIKKPAVIEMPVAAFDKFAHQILWTIGRWRQRILRSAKSPAKPGRISRSAAKKAARIAASKRKADEIEK